MADIRLRPLRSEDVDDLVRITRETGFFRPEEVEVSRELLTESASRGDASGYCVYVATNDKPVVGYVCFGPTPMTRGTWDIYWIVVDAKAQRRGVGTSLMQLAEAQIRRQSGRLAVVETSSQALYAPTRQFYRGLAYVEVSCIPDFYDAGDSKVIFIKNLSPLEVAAQ